MRRPPPPILLARRVTHIADILEDEQGMPRRQGRRPKPLESLVETILSQNTNDRNSHRAWLSLRKNFPTWEAVARAPVRSLSKAIEVGGLKNQKALRIKEILRFLKRVNGSYELDLLFEMSDDEAFAYLTAMKGVGKKTGACVLVFSLGRDVFPVDTHIHRICNRLGIVRTKSADETYDSLRAIVPPGRAYSLHVNLIRFGRDVCRSNSPLCASCALFDECTFERKFNMQEAIQLGKRSRTFRSKIEVGKTAKGKRSNTLTHQTHP